MSLRVDPTRLMAGVRDMLRGTPGTRERDAAVHLLARDIAWRELEGTTGEEAALAVDLEARASAGEGPLLPQAAEPIDARLAAALTDRGGLGAGQVANLRILEGGYSKETALFDWRGADGASIPLVLRRDLASSHVGTSVREEYDRLLALYRIGLPVPEPLLLDDSEDDGRAFMVVRRLPGGPIGGVAGATDIGFDPTVALARFLARLHAVSPATLGLDGFTDQFTRSDLIAKVHHWRDRYLAYAEHRSPLAMRAFAWLEENADIGVRRASLVHGDCGLYNMLFDGDRFVAMLDWELLNIGSAIWDVAYVREAVGQFRSFDAFLDDYEAAGGIRPSAAEIDYYDLFQRAMSIALGTVGVGMFNRGEPVRLDLVSINCRLYPRWMTATRDLLARLDR